MSIDEKAFWSAMGSADFDVQSLSAKNKLEKFVRDYEAAKGSSCARPQDDKTEVNQQPVGCSRSVILSLKAALALTKKYLFLVGEQRIGDKEITELRETHYRVENALDELQRVPERESVSQWQPIDSAPRDGKPILVMASGWSEMEAEVARWDFDKYAKKPKPFWIYDRWRSQISRLHPPTHWMPLPLPPEQSRQGSATAATIEPKEPSND